MTVRVGLVGAGAVGTRHARALAAFPDAEVVAVADPHRDAADALAAELGVPAHDGHDALIDGHDLDALYVCVPPFAHGPPERAAIDAGLPFFVEKPIALDVAAAEEVARLVRERGLLTSTGYHWRHLDTVQAARELAADRPPRLVLAYWLDKVPPPAWWVRRDRSGGQTVEQTTHVLDLVRVLAGEVEDVHARTSTSAPGDFPDADVPDVSVATLSFESGALGSIFSTCLLAAKLRAGVEVFCEGLALELSETELVVNDGGERRVLEASTDARSAADRAFVDAVQGHSSRVLVDYEEALRTHRLACAVAGAGSDGGT